MRRDASVICWVSMTKSRWRQINVQFSIKSGSLAYTCIWPGHIIFMWKRLKHAWTSNTGWNLCILSRITLLSSADLLVVVLLCIGASSSCTVVISANFYCNDSLLVGSPTVVIIFRCTQFCVVLWARWSSPIGFSFYRVCRAKQCLTIFALRNPPSEARGQSQETKNS